MLRVVPICCDWLLPGSLTLAVSRLASSCTVTVSPDTRASTSMLLLGRDPDGLFQLVLTIARCPSSTWMRWALGSTEASRLLVVTLLEVSGGAP